MMPCWVPCSSTWCKTTYPYLALRRRMETWKTYSCVPREDLCNNGLTVERASLQSSAFNWKEKHASKPGHPERASWAHARLAGGCRAHFLPDGVERNNPAL